MNSTRNIRFLPHLFAAIEAKHIAPPKATPPTHPSLLLDGPVLKNGEAGNSLTLPSSYFDLSSLNMTARSPGRESDAAIRRTIKRLSGSLPADDIRDILMLLNRRKTAPLPLISENKIRRFSHGAILHTPGLSHTEYIERLSKPRNVYFNRRDSQHANECRGRSVDLNDVCKRLARHRSFETVVRKYANHASPDPSEASSEHDASLENTPLGQTNAIDLRPYIEPTELVAPRGRSCSDRYRRTQRITSRLPDISETIMKLVDTGEKVIGGEFDNWVAEMLDIEVLPSLCKRFPDPDSYMSFKSVYDSAPLTLEAFIRIGSYQPNRLLLIRLREVKHRIETKIRAIVRRERL